MSKSYSNKPYQQLVADYIRAAGEQLIADADHVADGLELINGIDININLDPQNASVPLITYSVRVWPKKVIDKMKN